MSQVIAGEIYREDLSNTVLAGRDTNSHEDWVALLTRHVGLATPETPGRPVEPDRWERQMRRVARIALAAIETNRMPAPRT